MKLSRTPPKGFRRISLWVPDTRAPAFAKACRKQSLLVAKSDGREGIGKELDQTARDVEGWTA